jgi:hypothetical protein
MYDPVDQRGVPASRGVPMVVIIAAIIGILGIFAMGAWTIYNAGYGHQWPWSKALRIPLNGSYRH